MNGFLKPTSNQHKTKTNISILFSLIYFIICCTIIIICFKLNFKSSIGYMYFKYIYVLCKYIQNISVRYWGRVCHYCRLEFEE